MMKKIVSIIVCISIILVAAVSAYASNIVSLTVKNPLDNSQYILLYGDIFESQIAYAQKVADDYAKAVVSSEHAVWKKLLI